MLVHTCHATGCTETIKAERLMCATHWRLVPRDLQGRVWKSYVPGQEKHGRLSRGYVAAAREAIRAVERLEREAVDRKVDEARQRSLF